MGSALKGPIEKRFCSFGVVASFLVAIGPCGNCFSHLVSTLFQTCLVANSILEEFDKQFCGNEKHANPAIHSW